MSWIVPRRLAPVVVVLAMLLASMMYLQHRWIAEVSAAERMRMRHGLEAGAERLSGEVTHELRRALLAFHPDPFHPDPRVPHEERRAQLAEQMRAWRASAPFPELVGELMVVTGLHTGALRLERLEERSGTFVEAAWPEDLATLRQRMAGGAPGPAPALHLVEGPALVLVSPMDWPPAGHHHPGAVVVRIDRTRLVSSVLPRLVAAWFGSSSGDSLIAVMAPEGPVYLSDTRLPVSRYLPGDVVRPFFGAGPLDDDNDWYTAPSAALPGDPPLGPAWRLVVTHRAGSLEVVVGHMRNRNLAISTFVMLLLIGAVAVLALAARRAHRLARQQMDFVAGVTHELNTPITAMRSAAQNLADGVVSDPAQVRRYGTLIEREGARLSSLVAKALEMAGIHAGRARTYHPEALALPEIVDEVLADSRFVLDEKGVEIERDLPAGLPAVLADRRGVHLAVQNLIDNALKHAADGKWIGVRATAASDGRTVTLAVDDRGPGVAAEDRPHLFEPFYRGRGRSSGGAPVPGGGIGLGLVREVIEAQGGRVSVGPGPGGRGASFEMRLPVAPPERASA